MAEKRTRAAFVEPMLLLRTKNLPEGKAWLYELKFDGYRALVIKSSGGLHLRSRNDNDFNVRYPGIVKGLSALPGDKDFTRALHEGRFRNTTEAVAWPKLEVLRFLKNGSRTYPYKR